MPQTPATVASSGAISSAGPTLANARPFHLEIPANADAAGAPLVILLHGYGSSGSNHNAYFGLSKITNARGVILALPDGTPDHEGKMFWNASEACCDFEGKSIDDVAYVDSIIDDASSRAHVDPDRVYIIGHSNGAFMAHRYACDRSARVAAIVALAGVPWIDAARCNGKGVSVLQLHGDADKVIRYAGGNSFGNGAPYPSADVAIAAWAVRDGCGTTRHADGPAVDLDLAVDGPETTRESYTCAPGIAVTLWTMHGSGHLPQVDARFDNAILDFLLAHRKIH